MASRLERAVVAFLDALDIADGEAPMRRVKSSSLVAALRAALAAPEPAPRCTRCGEPITPMQSQLPDEVGLPRHKNCPAPAQAGEAVYPCKRCGVTRTKAEGGTTFTVCDECWDASQPSRPVVATPPAPDAALLERVARDAAEYAYDDGAVIDPPGRARVVDAAVSRAIAAAKSKEVDRA